MIAIVGRPNVGKSTLFNFLTRRREAVTANQPGVTRDFLLSRGRYGEADYWVMDTGGLNQNDKQHVVSAHTFQAAAEADHLIWMVDARDGLTADDEALAVPIQRLRKPISVAVNKIEGMDWQQVLADFYRIGSDLYPISALHGDGVHELITDIMDDQPAQEETEEPTHPAFRIVIIGRPNVGKSTLTNALSGQQRMLTGPEPGLTRDSVKIEFQHAGELWQLTDTSGVKRRSRVTDEIEKRSVKHTLRALHESSLAILVLDATSVLSDQDMRLTRLVIDSGKRFLIVLNKCDLHPSKEVKLRIDDMLHALRFVPRVQIHPLSALTGNGLKKLNAMINKIAQTRIVRIPTNRLNALLREAVERHPPPMSKQGRRPRLVYAHLTGQAPLTVTIHGRHVTHIPQHYRKYLVRYLGDRVAPEGAPLVIRFRKQKNPYVDKT